MSAEHDGRIESVPVDGLPAASAVACDAVRRGAVAVTIAITRGDRTRVTIAWPASRSAWVTWEPCPHCGDQAAVGWNQTGRRVDAVEFDCPNGCRPSNRELARRFPARKQGWTIAS